MEGVSPDGTLAPRNKDAGRTAERILIAVLTVIILILLLMRFTSCDADRASTDDQATPAAAVSTTQASSTSTAVRIPGRPSMTVEADTANITLGLYNPDANEGLYDLDFSLILDGETIYESGLVSCGQTIQTGKLTRELAAGTYQAVMHVQPYRVDGTATTTNADLATTLYVK